MADIFSQKKRSEIMRSVKGKNTKPELAVRKTAFSLGYRYRLHSKTLPGKPDLVFPKLRKVIFVHGCFWHQHKKCAMSHKPLSNQRYWIPKLEKNVLRDRRNKSLLGKYGWRVLTIWECETRNIDKVSDIVRLFLSSPNV